MQHFKHPLWPAQVALEKGMMLEGARRVQDGVAKAVNKNARTRLKPYQDLLQAWLPKIADDLRAWVQQASRSRGVKPVALEPLAECDPYVAALIALRAILDSIGARRHEVTSLAIHIGASIEHELQIRLWEKSEPALYHAQQNRLKAQHADHTHTERVNINAFNKLLAEGKFSEGWERWDTHKKLFVGTALLDSIIRATGWFETARDEGLGARAPVTLALKPGMESWVRDRLSKIEECSPALKPTIMQPKRWTGMDDGGYWTPYVQGPSLIRFRAYQIDQKDRAHDEYNALDMPKVYEALHFLQETPWRINRRVNDVVHAALKRNLVIGELQDWRPRELPPKPANIATSEKARTLWKRKATEARGHNALLLSKQLTFNRIMGIAHEYREFDRFYFPHKLDFRGRMYAIPVALQPQGGDLARGLLEFADGKPVTPENQGDAWLAVNLASAWGNDKVGFDDRIAWVHANNDKWRRIAKDPLRARKDWAGEADKPWQFLAACYDWVGFLEHGWGYVSHAPIYVDGTCNGLQHLSALSRDPQVGEHVNLLPGDKPRDIYQYVADCLIPSLTRIAEQRGEPGAMAAYWLGFAKDGKLPRSLLKRPVMILAYSATREAFFRYTKEWLDEQDPAPRDADTEQWAQRYKRLGFIVGLMWDAVHVAVPRAMDIMAWLKKCAAVAAVGNQPVFWVTPDGFVVRHFYGKVKTFRIKVQLDASDFKLRLHEPTKELDKTKQLLGISPNFVHSFDACAARGCINKAAEGGEVTAFASIHDSFGTHAADMWKLYGYLREAFVEVHEGSVLANYRNGCMRVMVGEMVARGIDPFEASQIADEKLPPVPELGDLDIRGVMESDYFFA